MNGGKRRAPELRRKRELSKHKEGGERCGHVAHTPERD